MCREHTVFISFIIRPGQGYENKVSIEYCPYCGKIEDLQNNVNVKETHYTISGLYSYFYYSYKDQEYVGDAPNFFEKDGKIHIQIMGDYIRLPKISNEVSNEVS